MKNKLEQAIALIDQKNSQDPNKEIVDRIEIAKELLYSQRMTEKLLGFYPEASDQLHIAARAQHICRWSIPRKNYPLGKAGYFKWRNKLKKIHGELARDILNELNYEEDFIERVVFLINKKQIKEDQESKTLEDVICLVFLEFYLEDFISKHPPEKIIDILEKTWNKMSAKGQEFAMDIKYSDLAFSLIKKAIDR